MNSGSSRAPFLTGVSTATVIRGRIAVVRGGRLGTALLTATAMLLGAGSASAVVGQTPLGSAWVTTGHVHAIARLGSRAYLGGDFSFVGPLTGAGALLDESKVGYAGASPSLQPGFPVVDGPIDAVVPDGSGGFYIGGQFAHVGAATQHNLAHVLANNKLDTAFKPSLTGSVSALALSGGQLLVGGSFNGVSAAQDDGIASVNPATGVATPGWAHQFAVGVDGTVSAIAVSGSNVYVGGQFSFVLDGAGNSDSVTNLAELNLADGTPVASFHPAISGGTSPAVQALQVVSISGASALLVGGSFTTPHSNLTAIKLADGSDISLGSYPNGPVYAIAYDAGSGSAWIGGSFNTVGALGRGNLAKYELPNFDTNWNPGAGGAVRALTLLGSELVVGGDFATMTGGTSSFLKPLYSRAHLGAVSASVGAGPAFLAPVAAWNPGAGNSVSALAARTGTTVFAGGFFTSVDGLTRDGIAALDLPGGTGDTGFRGDVNPGETVWALQSDGARLYAGGDFTKIDNSPSPSVAELDPATGSLAPGFASTLGGGTVETLALSSDGSKLYAGGLGLTVLGGNLDLDAFNASSGAFLTGAAPSADGPVVRLLTSGDTVYVAGHFSQLGGAAHAHLGAFSSSTGAVIPSFAPAVSGSLGGSPGVTALALSGSRLYIGGQFTAVGGAGHLAIAAVDAGSGAVDDNWRANVDGQVLGLAVLGNHLYAAGGFRDAGPSDQRYGLAAFSLADGGLSPDWHPQLTGDAAAITGEAVDAPAPGDAVLAAGNALLVADGAQRVDGALRSGFAEFAFAVPGPGSPKVLGSPWPGQRLACSVNGAGAGAESYGFSWLRDGKGVGSGQTYTVASRDVGHRIACRLLATNPAATVVGTSASVKITLRPGGPRVKLSKSARASKSGVVSIKVTCPRGFTLCAGRLSLSSGLGRGSFKLHGGRSTTVRVKLPQSAFRRLKKKHSLKVRASATAHDASNRYATVSRTLKLLAPIR
jgi:trimeric autotransporter adhesin